MYRHTGNLKKHGGLRTASGQVLVGSGISFSRVQETSWPSWPRGRDDNINPLGALEARPVEEREHPHPSGRRA